MFRPLALARVKGLIRRMPSQVAAKICGISTPETMDAAISGGAAFVGLAFFDKSPRNLTPEAASRLADRARGKTRIVALMVDPDDAAVDRIASLVRPDLIQLHGRETPTRASAIAARTRLGVIKALPVSSAEDLIQAKAYDEVVEHLMFDAKPPKDAERPGGHGAAFDWTLLAGRKFKRPHFLAGGLDPWNVGDALRLSGAPLADVSSGVERGPGVKDPGLISAFLDAVRRV